MTRLLLVMLRTLFVSTVVLAGQFKLGLDKERVIAINLPRAGAQEFVPRRPFYTSTPSTPAAPVAPRDRIELEKAILSYFMASPKDRTAFYVCAPAGPAAPWK